MAEEPYRTRQRSSSGGRPASQLPPASAGEGGQYRRGRRSSPSRPTKPRLDVFSLVRIAAGAVVLVVLVVLLIWHFRRDVVREGQATNPFWQADGTVGALQAARAALSADPPDPQKAASIARAALAGSPLNISALGTVASAEKLLGSRDASDAAYRLMLDHSRRDTDAMFWLAQRSLENKDYGGLIEAADAFLRINLDNNRSKLALAMLVALSADPKAVPVMIDRLKLKPSWRIPFLRTLAADGSIDRFPLFMEALDVGTQTGVDPLWSGYLGRLVTSGEARTAYAIWVGLLPPEQAESIGNVFNGGFELPLSRVPFDWLLNRQRGTEALIDTVKAPEGNSALSVTFTAAVSNPVFVWQTLVLDPGSYVLAGKVRLDNLKTPRGLVWGLYCRNGRALTNIGRSDFFVGSSDWRDFQFKFDVPAKNCDAQLLRLENPARIESEKQIKGRIWFDDLSIQPATSDNDTASPPNG